MTQTEVVSASNKDIAPYGEYKDSGVPWLGEIPAHWEVPRLGSMIRFRNLRNHPDMPLLSVVRERGVIPRSAMSDDENHNFIPDDLSNYKVVVTGDLVINKMKAWQGSLGIASQGGIVSPAYYVLELNNVNKDFSHRQLRSKPFVHMFARASDGVRIGQWDLSPEQLKRIPIPLPPLDEQAAIVRYLAHVDRKIDRFVRAKRRLIALLEEQKQALIHQAVTKGLDPDVPMKDSGVEWLGEIPAHWDLVALRRYWDVIDCKHVTVPFHDEGFPLASVREAQRFDLDLTYAKRTSQEHYKLLIDGGRKPRAGDLIYCRNTSVGSAAYVSEHEDFAMGQDVCLIRSEAHNGRYLNYQLASNVMMEQLRRLLIGSTIPRINVASVRSLMTLVPPVQEQGAIVENLDRLTSEYREAIARQIREIDLIREYRTRLVSDVVTGKLDVREAAAALPEIDLHEAHFADAPEIDEVAEADQHDELDGADE